ncbi:hypothetical protein F4802DRAFT_468215 [Xylaria palmicola]|nr:hypothetical protein F4802DRAFT_468215 [Xylaria palmicola]
MFLIEHRYPCFLDVMKTWGQSLSINPGPVARTLRVRCSTFHSSTQPGLMLAIVPHHFRRLKSVPVPMFHVEAESTNIHLSVTAAQEWRDGAALRWLRHCIRATYTDLSSERIRAEGAQTCLIQRSQPGPSDPIRLASVPRSSEAPSALSTQHYTVRYALQTSTGYLSPRNLGEEKTWGLASFPCPSLSSPRCSRIPQLHPPPHSPTLVSAPCAGPAA